MSDFSFYISQIVNQKEPEIKHPPVNTGGRKSNLKEICDQLCLIISDTKMTSDDLVLALNAKGLLTSRSTVNRVIREYLLPQKKIKRHRVMATGPARYEYTK